MWTAPPAGTVELALLVTDDDAGGFVHWAVAGDPAAAGEDGEGAADHGGRRGPQRLRPPGLGGPCPPAGPAHTYRFTLYALTQQAELPDGFTGADLADVAPAGSIASAEVDGDLLESGLTRSPFLRGVRWPATTSRYLLRWGRARRAAPTSTCALELLVVRPRSQPV